MINQSPILTCSSFEKLPACTESWKTMFPEPIVVRQKRFWGLMSRQVDYIKTSLLANILTESSSFKDNIYVISIATWVDILWMGWTYSIIPSASSSPIPPPFLFWKKNTLRKKPWKRSDKMSWTSWPDVRIEKLSSKQQNVGVKNVGRLSEAAKLPGCEFGRERLGVGNILY